MKPRADFASNFRLDEAFDAENHHNRVALQRKCAVSFGILFVFYTFRHIHFDAEARNRVPLTDFHCRKTHAAVVKRVYVYQRHEERDAYKNDELSSET